MSLVTLKLKLMLVMVTNLRKKNLLVMKDKSLHVVDISKGDEDPNLTAPKIVDGKESG